MGDGWCLEAVNRVIDDKVRKSRYLGDCCSNFVPESVLSAEKKVYFATRPYVNAYTGER